MLGAPQISDSGYTDSKNDLYGVLVTNTGRDALAFVLLLLLPQKMEPAV